MDTNRRIEPSVHDSHQKMHRTIMGVAQAVVLVLSVLLIVYISYDTFANIPFLQNREYMTFQFWVCMVFLLDFFLGFSLSSNKWNYLKYHWFFFVISIPYLNIIEVYDIQFAPNALYFIRFIPLVRGAYALAMVVGYFSSNRATSILSAYAAILMSIIYFASLIFFQQEKPVNSAVNDYWEALWWAFMNVTTIGCYINPMTIGGKICAVVLAAMGMMMLPLFTVFITSKVQDYNDRKRRQEELLNNAKDREIASGNTTSASPAADATVDTNQN